MERLTDNTNYCSSWSDCDMAEGKCVFYGNCYDRKIYNKLRDYEDLEEQGLLLKLPCKVGDKVWCIFEGEIYEAIAQKVTVVTGLDNYKLIKIEAEFWIDDYFYGDGRKMRHGRYGNYLEDIFLTKTEAEKALAEMKGK